MATIITVHGTNASGPEEGAQWWQKGGPLDRHLGELVEGENGTLSLKPLIWDGANSETSRRAGAAKLLETMEGLEAVGERYCVIAHSHGGSVAAHALLLAAAKQQALPGLAVCVTVGTPFIVFNKSRWLFQRSKLLEKAAMVAVGGFALLFIVFLVWAGHPYRGFSTTALFGYALVVGPFLALYLGLGWSNAKRYRIYEPAVLKFLERTFAGRLLALRHENDEAIYALRSLRRLRIPFFGPHFAVPALSLMSLVIVPVAVLFLAQSETFMSAIAEARFGITEVKSNWLENIASVIINISLTIGNGFYRALEWAGISYRPPFDPIGFSVFLGAVGGAFGLALISLPVTTLAVQGAKFVSSVTSRLLNPLTWAQIRTAAFGNDTLGEVASDAGPVASWSAVRSAALPSELAEEITKLSNASAGEAMQKFRDAMNRLLLSDEREAKEFFFSEYISWDELIHTRYFDSPRFRMFLGHALAQAEGFRESVAFRDHPERTLVAGWFDAMLAAHPGEVVPRIPPGNRAPGAR